MKCPVVMRPTSRAGREVSKMVCSMLPGKRCGNKQYLYGSAADYEQRFSMGFRKFNLEAFKRLCVKASGLGLCQASQHETHHGNVDPGFFTARKHLIVFGESAPGGKPGEGALNNPMRCLSEGVAPSARLQNRA